MVDLTAEEKAELTPGEVQDLIAGFAMKNPEYSQSLLAHPREVLGAQLKLQIPDTVKVTTIEEKPNEFHIILPYQPTGGEELSEAELASLAGGSGKPRGKRRSAEVQARHQPWAEDHKA